MATKKNHKNIGDRERDRKIWKKKILFFRRIHFCLIFSSYFQYKLYISVNKTKNKKS